MDPTHVVTVLGLVENDAGEIMLVRAAERGWELPGGRVEAGEGLILALEREVLEETGCTVRVEKLVGIHSRIDAPTMVLHLFRCTYLAGLPRPSDPVVAEASWFSRDAACSLVSRPESRERLDDALANHGGVVVKAYQGSPYAILSTVLLR